MLGSVPSSVIFLEEVDRISKCLIELPEKPSDPEHFIGQF